MPPLENFLSDALSSSDLKNRGLITQDLHSVERALRESQDKFAHAFHGSIDAVAIADFPSGAMTEVNDAYCRLFGYTREETIGRSGSELGLWAEASDRERFIEILDRKGAVSEMEAVKLTKSGRRLICRITSSRLKIGDRAVIVTRIRDITEQRMAEAALRESEEKFSKAFRAVPDSIAITTLAEGRLLDVNAAFAGTFGWTRDEVLGRSTLELSIWADPKERARLVERLRAGEIVHNLPVVFCDKGGALHSCIYFGEVTEIAGQACLISIIRDMTRQQQLEEQLRHAQKMESIGLLAGGVAHDFNNILTVIQGNISLVLLDKSLPAGLNDMLRQVQDATEFAATLTRQLLVFSRRQVLQPDRVSLGDAIRRVVKLLRRTLGEHIVLRVEADPSTPDAVADVCMMEQVLLNLAVNARDAMPNGGELVISAPVLDADDDYVRRVPQAKEGRFVGIRVRDTGVGISADVLSKIFDPFFTTKAFGQGTGLGLATVHAVAQQHGGWIEVDSEVGRGTQFTVWFPRHTSAPPAPAHPAAPAAGKGSETLLLVEDKEEVRAVLTSVFARNGYRTLLAGNGPEALKIWEEHRDEISLLFTDIVMPGGMNGRELAECLRAERPGLKVVYCSGYDANVLGSDALQAAGTRFLGKPFGVAQTVRLVRELLDQN
jgi:two-component system, cell cycle sensor histidine kinase and response regulator CckA